MQKLFEAAAGNPLFEGIEQVDFGRMFACLSAKTVRYKKNGVIFLAGDTVSAVGLILTGRLKVIKEDVDGNAAIQNELSAPELFGETFACAGITHSPVTVQASEDAEVLYIDYKKIVSVCTAACPFHARLIENMLGMIARKNIKLNQKIDILSRRTTREKLLCFFDYYRGPAKKFAIPFNREELARYICVDRSAMSSELCKMRDEGLIRFHKNVFEI